MATTTRRAVSTVRRCVCGRFVRAATPMPLRRPFSVSTVRKDSAGSSSFNEFSFDATTLSQDEREFYESLSPSDRAEFEEVALSDEQMEQMLKRASAVQSEVEEGLARELGPIDARIRALDTDTGPDREPRVPQGFFNMSEDEDLGPDDEEDGDISSLGHSELEKHRELREYARRIAWEMPLLSKLARPFELPSPSHFLRFRYTTYMGEEHPAASKVVLEFSPVDIPSMTPVQRAKLIKLVGPRYNPGTESVKMSAELFPTQAQNKRYLLDQVSTLLREARDPTDTFEDVPFDFRHHKAKPWHEFPKEWLMTAERRKALEERRMERIESEEQRLIEGTIVDGLQHIHKSFATIARQPLSAPANARGPLRRR